MNKKIFGWLNSGQISEALLGENSFFIPDHTYRDHHDRLLVMYNIFEWSNSKKNRESAEVEFYSALKRSLNNGLTNALDLILVYCIVKKNGPGFLDESEFIYTVKSIIDSHAKEIVEDEVARNTVLTIEKYFPKVRG